MITQRFTQSSCICDPAHKGIFPNHPMHLQEIFFQSQPLHLGWEWALSNLATSADLETKAAE
jgi:hypothetical protein